MMAADETPKRGLGRGLSALLGDEPAEDAQAPDPGRAARVIPVEHIHPSPFQPRKQFDDEAFAALVGSVRDRGVLQPLLVRPDADNPGQFELVAGERRWRAAQQAQLHEVPAVVKELNDQETLEVALVENLQREDLTPLEEAEAYVRLINEFGHTQEILARAVGKSRSHVANTLRLLNLPDPVKRMLGDGLLSAGHARALVNAENPSELAEEILHRGLNVRQAEDLSRRAKTGGDPTPRAVAPAASPADPNIVDLEKGLAELLGLKVKVSMKSGGAGTLTVHYKSPEQLEDVLKRLSDRPGE